MTRLIVLGDLNLDVFVRDDHAVDGGDEIRSTVRALPGGSAGTFARVAASHGAETVFVGAVGEGGIGDLLERSLIESGVTPRLARVPIPSGVIVAIHRGDERSMICSRGANDGLSSEAIDPELFATTDHLHVSGYALLSAAQLPAVQRALTLAVECELTLSVDPPPANLIDSFGTERFLDLIPSGTWLFPNRTEGEVLTGEVEPETIVTRLAARSEAGALTLGAAGSLAWHRNARHARPVTALESVDTTGAGDAFAGAFVVTLLATGDLSEAVRQAGDAAAAHIAPRSA